MACFVVGEWVLRRLRQGRRRGPTAWGRIEQDATASHFRGFSRSRIEKGTKNARIGGSAGGDGNDRRTSEMSKKEFCC